MEGRDADPPRGDLRPTPRALHGRTDPARRVTPVDFSRPGGSQPRTGAAEPAVPDHPANARSHRRLQTLPLPRRAAPPPAGAVHTLDADDPRPAPRPLRIEEGPIRRVGVDRLDPEAIVLAVAEPEDAWSADAGASDHFLRGGIVVQVRRADSTVIGVFTRAYALAVRPERVERTDIDVITGPTGRGGRGTRHPTSRRELLARLDAAGFVVRDGRRHGRITHPDHPGLFVPMASTPSDVRYTRHAVAQIRRVFGVDLRH